MRNIDKGKKMLGPNASSLEWVKAHIRIKDNEEADK